MKTMEDLAQWANTGLTNPIYAEDFGGELIIATGYKLGANDELIPVED